jgi:hypothetical protein
VHAPYWGAIGSSRKAQELHMETRKPAIDIPQKRAQPSLDSVSAVMAGRAGAKRRPYRPWMAAVLFQQATLSISRQWMAGTKGRP